MSFSCREPAVEVAVSCADQTHLSRFPTAATSTADLHNIITNGKGRMPKYANKLTSEEIDTLVQQIKTLSKKE
jgi:hypothetical protein